MSTDHGLPRLWAGRRRRHLTLLVAAGLGQAVAAGVGAHMVLRVLQHADPRQRLLAFGSLVGVAVLVGALRMAERLLAELLSQDYVHDVRVRLVRRNLEGAVRSVGVAVARATNDLTSVRSWVTQGIAPLAVGVPLLGGALVALAALSPVLCLGLVVPLVALALGLRALSPAAFERARRLRKVRGRLASQVADTILAAPAVRSAGGERRELRRLERTSRELVAAATHRARVAGAQRGLSAATTGLTTATMVGLGLLAGASAGQVAAGLTVVGFLATPIQDLGRVAEFRQTYRAARRILGPAVAGAATGATGAAVSAASADSRGSRGSAAPRPTAPAATGPGAAPGLDVRDLAVGEPAITLPTLVAPPGSRVLIDTGDAARDAAALAALVGLADGGGPVHVDGVRLVEATYADRRRLVGYAARGLHLPPGSIARATLYRTPDADRGEAGPALARVGLEERVAALPRGVDTRLRNGGEPLTVAERARLQLARAMVGDPRLLVLDHLDADLGAAGRRTLRDALADYTGVVVLASDHPDQVVDLTHVWRVDGVETVDR